VYLEPELVEALARRLYPATRHLGLEKVVVRLNVLDRGAPGARTPRPRWSGARGRSQRTRMIWLRRVPTDTMSIPVPVSSSIRSR